MSIEQLSNKLVDGSVTKNDFAVCCDQLNCSLPDVFNQISLHLAKRFLNQDLAYEAADSAMNMVWAAMLEFMSGNNLPLVEPCYSIYQAFDEGEYDHRDGSDPVETYTRPALNALVKMA